MIKHSCAHATFVIERVFDAAPQTVFQAFSDPKAKAQWFRGPDTWDVNVFEQDFRVGGREINRGGPKGGTIHTFTAHYHDIVPNVRIVFSYDMHLDDKRISVSLTTVEFSAKGKGTQLTFTEQGVFLDGYDDAGSRERGTGELLNVLGAFLAPKH